VLNKQHVDFEGYSFKYRIAKALPVKKFGESVDLVEKTLVDRVFNQGTADFG